MSTSTAHKCVKYAGILVTIKQNGGLVFLCIFFYSPGNISEEGFC